MPFIGTQPEVGGYSVLDSLTASATASYTLQLNSANFSPASANQLLVSLNGVIQKPGSSFTVSGSTLTFSSALDSSDSIDFIIAMGEPLLIGTPSDGTVSTAKLATNAITSAKLASNIGISTTGNIATTGSGTLTSAGLITATSGMTVGNANITMSNGYGIDFAATANSSGTVTHEILDDYEIGDWTPTVYSGGWGLSTSMAKYTKIGRQVTVMTDTSLTGSGNSSDLIISGLPFTNSTNGYASGAGYMQTYPTGTNNHFTPMVSSNSTYVYFMNGNGAYYDGNQFSAGYFNFNVTYFV